MIREAICMAMAIVGGTMELQAERLHFINAQVLRHGELVPGELCVENGRIVSLESADASFETIDLGGAIVAPGFIDLQLNGAFGHDFSKDPSSVLEVARQLPQYGVTSFLPTLISSKKKVYQQRPALTQESNGAEPLGWHFEGPFLSHAFSGMHSVDVIPQRHLTRLSDLEKFYGGLADVRMITLAPEFIQRQEVVTALTERGIVVAAGHTAATEQQMLASVEAGLSMVTHLYNAMRPLHHRESGVIGVALTDPRVYYGIIMDGYHVGRKAVELAYKAHPEGLILVTDAMAAMGAPKGKYHLGGADVYVENGRVTLSGTDTLAGSALTMDQAVRMLVEVTGCGSAYALEAASLRPAEALGIADRKGKLEAGYDADLVVLDKELSVITCYVKGKRR